MIRLGKQAKDFCFHSRRFYEALVVHEPEVLEWFTRKVRLKQQHVYLTFAFPVKILN